MANKRKNVRFFKTHPENEKVQQALRVFSVLKKARQATVHEIVKQTGISRDVVNECVDFCEEKGFIRKESSDGNQLVGFNPRGKKFLGVGFGKQECVLTVMDLSGGIIEKEKIVIQELSFPKPKRKDIKNIVDRIQEKAKLENMEFYIAGIAIPERIEKTSIRNVDLLAHGVGKIFGCNVYLSREATAAGYGERNFGWQTKGRDILYLHFDVGAGVIVKDEMIFEADEGDADRAYLRPWHQFSIVENAKKLISKGVGTGIVDVIQGDVNNITLDIVLQAADEKDELAEDLMQRAALVLGMRAAYLINMFMVRTIILGGGIESGKQGFIEYVRESANKFLLKEVRGKVEIIYGTLGASASSLGASALCCRELFMEV
ncbi:MAG: ROK family transcriptional regulator [Candidatus Omnitrophota bacterium]|nr:ROK family transcriptional regulator [Candidatus Omnitrophota bacterium]